MPAYRVISAARRRAFASALLLSLTAACGSGPAPAAIPSVARPLPTSVAEVDALINELRSLPGEYVLARDVGGYTFRGDEGIFRALGAADTLAVPRLIECVGDDSPTRVTFEGSRILLGKLCFHALGQTRYFQSRLGGIERDDDYRVAGSLPGKSNPSGRELRSARDWWRRYHAAGSPRR